MIGMSSSTSPRAVPLTEHQASDAPGADELRLYAENDGAFFEKHLAPFMQKCREGEPSLEQALKIANEAARSYWLELVAYDPSQVKVNHLTLFPINERKKVAIFWCSRMFSRKPRIANRGM